jgi:hypothetical protein
MRLSMAVFACVLAAGVATAGPAFCDDSSSSLRSELEALKRKVAEQERALRSLENKAPTDDELSAAVSRYLGSAPPTVMVGGAEGGKAGWPMGGAPFISEGPNKINFHMRNQVRYSAFLYSDDAVGVLGSPDDTLSDAAPRDRSGFEIERMQFGIDGSIFCPEITFNLNLNFDSDTSSGLEKEFAWLDWKYWREHHVRGGVDKVPFTYEEQNSSGALAFVDRSLFTKAFALDSDTGVQLWGNFGPCDCPKSFLYKLAVTTGEGPPQSAGSVFNFDAFDSYSDQPLVTGMLEWTITCKDWKYDEVDSRSCDERCRLEASVGVAAYYENDDDGFSRSPGLVLRSSGRHDRMAFGAWARARWQGFTGLVEFASRTVDYASAAETQTDSGATAMVHYRFADSNWGVGARGSIIWLDDDYDTLSVGAATVAIEDTITEVGVVVNYFFWDHANKVSADVTFVQDNSAVRSSSAGYLFNPALGVIVEDGVYLRIQWQINI